MDDNIKEFLDHRLTPELDKIGQIIDSSKTSKGKDVCLNYWRVFLDNIYVLSNLLLTKKGTYQLASTMRYLMETSAELYFIANNTDNIDSLFSKTIDIEKERSQGLLDYRKATDKAQGLRVTCSKCKEAPGPRKKVYVAFSKYERVKEMYDYFCIYTHPNYLGIVWNNKRSCIEQEQLKEHLYIYGFLYYSLEITTHSVGKICHNDELINYDIAPVKNLCEEMQTSLVLKQ